ncbi:SDR family oxidoreductase [Desulforamulus ruminis]|uniref:SDR family oxidoreductase n=1 Tax=Desulforamulus ruminis TaxID=1564 RepID=UPI0023524918|nr:SDR family oxidoreductase [Desulforamulus ruminis]
MNLQDYHSLERTSFLVTGGAGFIGSNLVEVLLELGCSVKVLDNLLTGKEENINKYYGDHLFEFIKGDVRSIEDCKRACEGVDYILHQAALGSVPRSIQDPITTNDINISGTLNMLIAARDSKVKRFVYASSSSVYGDEPNLPKVEERIGRPLSPYAITKKVKELYAQNFSELYGLPTIGLRYFNVYGKRQDANSVYAAVIPTFIKKLLNNESPIINGDGLHSRDFTYIEDVIQANLKSCLAGEKAFGQVFNIAYGERITLNNLFEKIQRLLRKNVSPEYGPVRQGDVKHSNADIKKAKELLRYEPGYDINNGLALCIDWYKEHL